jgi:hypothetical protein
VPRVPIVPIVPRGRTNVENVRLLPRPNRIGMQPYVGDLKTAKPLHFCCGHARTIDHHKEHYEWASENPKREGRHENSHAIIRFWKAGFMVKYDLTA